ncbi:MAG: DUF2065 family protein [Arenibacterium sp.]
MEMAIMAIGLVLIVEGLAWMLAPSLLEQLLQSLRALSIEMRRQFGALALVIGLILLWIAQQLGA